MIQTIADALAQKGYDTLTPVQQAVSQPEYEGRDLLVSAQTGSGKTIGFGLAIAPTILDADGTFEEPQTPLALVIAPTRELAMQVKRELSWLYREAGVRMASCVGGMDMRDERRALARGAHIVVATPGRLRDHIMRSSIDLTHVRAVVLDEADEMLDLGFREDLEFILEETPAERQTLLFSATVPRAIASLATRYQKDAERISTVSETKQHADISYRAMPVRAQDADNAIINVLRYYEAPNAIVFCNTRAMVSRLTARLSNRGFSVVALSGELTQSERSNALQAMRDGRARICVATDVAARGIDLPNLDLVVHAELPNSHETLLHRSGRTGRAGRKGVSALVVAPAARKKAERILKFARLQAEWGPPPSADDVHEKDRVRMLEAETWATEISETERQAVDVLLENFSAEQLAAAYLRQYQERHSAPEDIAVVEDRGPKPRRAFGPSVWFSVSEGRADNASPRHLLPMICKAGDLTKDDIGGIRIAEDQSYFELRQEAVERFKAALGTEMVIEKTKAVTQLESAPDLPAFERSGPRNSGPRHSGPRNSDARKPHRGDRGDGPRKPRREDGPRPGGPRREMPDGDGPRAKTSDWDGPKPSKPRYKDRDDGPKDNFEPRKPRAKHAQAKHKSEARTDEGRKPYGKPNGKPTGKPGGGFKGKSERGKPEGAKGERGKSEGFKGGFKKDGPKGPPPPKGKPSSKKNKARAAATKAAKGGKGGEARPNRKG